VKIGSSSEIPPGTVVEINARGKIFAVANISGEFYAIDGICSHQGGRLGEGKLKDHILKCPRHGSEFDVRTGKNLKRPWIPFGKATDLKAYNVSKVGEDLYVEM
jgi:nitrite reductase (NADH) small subunit